MKKTYSILAVSALLSSTAMAESWDQSLDFGATISQGNSDSILISIGYQGTKVVDSNEYGVSLSYLFGETDDTTTNEEFLGSGYWNHLISEKSYAGVRGNFRTDNLADIDYRATVSGVFGHYLVKNESTYFAIEGGPGFTTEQVGGETDNDLSLYFGTKFEHKFSEKTRIYQTLSITGPADDLEDYSAQFEVGLETFLSESLALKVTVQDQYENQPPEGFDNNDFKLITSISYKF